MNHQPRTPSRASTIASQDSKSNAQHAALSGATKAFGRPAPQQRTSASSNKGGNGALAAAVTVGGGSRQSSPKGRRAARSPAPPLAPSSTGGSIQSSRNNGAYTRPTLGTSGAPNLQPPAPDKRQHSKSPSLQAASFAAARATPQPQQGGANDRRDSDASFAAARKPAAPPKPRRLSTQQSPASNEAVERPTDDTPIPPTTSLVKLFEKRGSQSSAKRPDPIVIKPSANMTIKSPKPVRTSGGLTSVFQMELPDGKARGEAAGDVAAAPEFDSSPDSFASASEDVTAPSSPETTMKGRASQQAQPLPKTAFTQPTIEKQPPLLPSSTRKATAKPVPIKAPDVRPSSAMSDRLSPSAASVKSLPAQFNQRYPRGRPPQMTGDQLANAMVASSLASSRGPSPQRSEAPPVPSRRHRHHTLGFSRTPSPAKAGMRQTLRKEASSDEDSEEDLLHPYSKHKKKRHLRKHPNKHDEGNRKRWRDAVTERERKRYEGVWAANKGLHCSFTPAEQSSIDKSPDSEEARNLKITPGEQISNIVAREIWSRSRLPEATLETVWDLVDNDCVGRLTKDEFVVGMFLIDYCLKGRKLPPNKVSESVWASVRGLQGIKVRK